MKIRYIPVLELPDGRAALIRSDVVKHIIKLDLASAITDELRHDLMPTDPDRNEITLVDLLKSLGTTGELAAASAEELIEHQRMAARYWMIDAVLRTTKGFVDRAAELMQVPVRTLRRWMRELNIDKKSYKAKKRSAVRRTRKTARAAA